MNPARAPEPWVGLLEVEEGSYYRCRTINLVLVDLRVLRQLDPDPAVIRESQDLILGVISISRELQSRGCGDAWTVSGSFAQRGWGPLLYDAALDYLDGIGADGLMPDRVMISQSAERIWFHYARERPDVLSRVPRHPGCPLYATPYLDRIYFAAPYFCHHPFREMRANYSRTISDLGLPEPLADEAVMAAADDFFEDGMGAGGAMRKTISVVGRRSA